ncbi:MAG: bifunctional phosphoglucose/phosphomannose isomerase [bacterium]
MQSTDKSNMFSMIQGWSDQLAEGLKLVELVDICRPITKIVLIGVGGSAWPADLVNCVFADDIKVPVVINRGYRLTTPVDASTLVIVNSYSGNTEETLSAYQEALKTSGQIVAMSAGGRLLELAQRGSQQFARVPKPSPNFPPRMACGYIIGALTALYIKAGVLPLASDRLLTEAADYLTKLNAEGQGKQLGESLLRTIPVFYAAGSYWPLAEVAKIQLNENTKIPAFFNQIPEFNHNEMAGFINTKDNYRIVIFRDPSDDPRINRQIDVAAALLRERPIGLKTTIWDMPGDTRAKKALSTILTAIWASYYLAMAMGVDPGELKLVDSFKQLSK